MKTWQSFIYTEASVVAALADFVFPGDLVFDVGSHIGGITAVLSRLVGPCGKVISFEANPKTADVMANQLISNALFNVFPVNRAVFNVSGERLAFYSTDSVSDSIISQPWNKGDTLSVKSISLGDWISVFNLQPSFLKFDIEGAEIFGLKGMRDYIAEKMPIIILEQSRDDFACIDLLFSLGYVAIDLHNYQQLLSVDSYPKDVASVRNVACIPKNSLTTRPNLQPYQMPRVESIFENALLTDGATGDLTSESIDLLPGRYILSSKIMGAESGVELYVGIVNPDNVFVALSHAVVSHFLKGRVEMPFHLEEATTCRICLRSCQGQDISESIERFEYVLSFVEGFKKRPHASMVLG